MLENYTTNTEITPSNILLVNWKIDLTFLITLIQRKNGGKPGQDP